MVKNFINFLLKNKFFKLINDGIKRLQYVSCPYPQEFKKSNFKKILIFAPHPDDEVIGLGGFILKYRNKIDTIYIFTNDDDEIRKKEAFFVMEKIKVNYEFVGNGTRILNDSLKNIKNIIKIKKPDLICIPSFYETHVDHFTLFYLTMEALKGLNYKGDILLYEVWNTLVPNYILDISDVFKDKKALINLYKSQINDFNYVKFIEGLNKYRGMQIGKEFGEGLVYIENKYLPKFIKFK